ncbi:unnamed protein product [Moneuplotes crassus]|uniref:Ankyrin repeat protein n=1 Tax=Euplotes crassus TaxID=5936 RepID=A0AAD2D2T5_EUPCR|nr:unnamed protein product [Moneuplotes crassus]
MGMTLIVPYMVDYEQIDAKVPDSIWELWPKTHNGINLRFIHNILIRDREEVAWYSPKVDTIFFSDNRYKLVYAICQEEYGMIQQVFDEGFDLNTPLDYKRGLNAFALATDLDKLEVLHFLELLESSKVSLNKIAERNTQTTIPEDISHGHRLTPLMIAVNSWNVRMVEYILSRNVDPTIKDKYGFSAKDKARVKNLNTISNIIEDYEEKYDPSEAEKYYSSKIKEESKILEYEKVYVNSFEASEYYTKKPSDLFKFHSHPFLAPSEHGYCLSLFNIKHKF